MAEQTAALPVEVMAALRDHGEPAGIERLGGMSRSRVYRVRFAEGSLVLKAHVSPAEAAFYERVAGRLRPDGVPSPALLGVVQAGEASWLLLEDVPKPYPPLNRLPLDARMVATLARLHAATRTWKLILPPPAHRPWSQEVTKEALSCFPAAAGELAPRLEELQERSRHLEAPWCWISGDPNPLNWGERADGTLVLYDWELFRRGVPATDLAITIAGLGNAEAYQALAGRYIDAWPDDAGPLPWTRDALAQDVGLAKVASVVDFLSLYARGAVHATEGLIDWLIESVPAWVCGFD
ncbi:MAG TPA: phosphotransferase [Dehalococcoidia bacterium]|jgi:aminoglycoside phosphotransferase (APT) family kinase protein|nr:phosphotransferase [Dehalococcoidia bacterium]